MTDFLNELQSDIQEENLLNLWRQYGKFVIAFMVFVLLATGVYLFWKHKQETILNNQSLQYEKALRLIQEKKHEEALAILDTLEKTKDGYKDLALLQKTALKARLALNQEGQEDPKRASLLKEAFSPLILSGGGRIGLGGLATIALGFSLIHLAQSDFFVMQTIEGYITPEHPWKGLALELKVLQAFQDKHKDFVEKNLSTLLQGRDVPHGIQTRVSLELMGMGISIKDNET